MRHAALVMLLQCAVALAQAPATISIYGHVYADDTGEPLRGVKLMLTDYSGLCNASLIPRQSRGLYFVSRSKRLVGVADAAPIVWATSTVAGYSSSFI